MFFADGSQSGEQPLDRPAFLGGSPFTPTSAQPLPAGLDTSAGPGDESTCCNMPLLWAAARAFDIYYKPETLVCSNSILPHKAVVQSSNAVLNHSEPR